MQGKAKSMKRPYITLSNYSGDTPSKQGPATLPHRVAGAKHPQLVNTCEARIAAWDLQLCTQAHTDAKHANNVQNNARK